MDAEDIFLRITKVLLYNLIFYLFFYYLTY